MANQSSAPSTRMCTECARDFELVPGATGRPPSKCPECRGGKSEESDTPARASRAQVPERPRAVSRETPAPEKRRAPGKAVVPAHRRQPSVRAQRVDTDVAAAARVQESTYVPELKEKILGEIDQLESQIAARLRVLRSIEQLEQFAKNGKREAVAA